MCRDQFDPKSPNYSLYRIQLVLIKRSYPGGNFEENQQLNDSMSISPLYKTESIDLHVRTPVGPPPDFHQASTSSCKDHHLSGCIIVNFTQNVQKNHIRPKLQRNVTFLITPFLLSLRVTSFHTTTLSTMMHSLVRVSRRDRKSHFVRRARAVVWWKKQSDRDGTIKNNCLSFNQVPPATDCSEPQFLPLRNWL